MKHHKRPREHVRIVRTKRGRRRITINKGIRNRAKRRTILQNKDFKRTAQRLNELASKGELQDYEMLDFLQRQKRLNELSNEYKQVRRKAPSPGMEMDELFFNQAKNQSKKSLAKERVIIRKPRLRGEVYDIDELL